MYSKCKFIFLLLLSFFIFPSIALAQVVINEINPSGEWVELFKTSTGVLSLEGCMMYFQDTKSQKKSLSVDDNFIENEFYKVIFTNESYLNNSSSDFVSLECPSFTLEPVIYGDNIGTKSFARIPNGVGSFVNTTQVTQGNENPSPTPEPTVTPTSTPTQTATATSTTTSTPTKTATATPVKTATSKPTTTATPTEKPTVEPEPENKINLTDTDIKVKTSPEGIVAGATTTKKSPLLSILFIISGVGFLGYGGYLIYNSNHGKKDPGQ